MTSVSLADVRVSPVQGALEVSVARSAISAIEA